MNVIYSLFWVEIFRSKGALFSFISIEVVARAGLCKDCYPDNRYQIQMPRIKQSLEEPYALTFKKRDIIHKTEMKYRYTWEHNYLDGHTLCRAGRFSRFIVKKVVYSV